MCKLEPNRHFELNGKVFVFMRCYGTISVIFPLEKALFYYRFTIKTFVICFAVGLLRTMKKIKTEHSLKVQKESKKNKKMEKGGWYLR